MEFKIIKKEIITDFGKEIVILKKYNLDKNQWRNRIWVFQPQDKEYLQIKDKLEELWKTHK